MPRPRRNERPRTLVVTYSDDDFPARLRDLLDGENATVVEPPAYTRPPPRLTKDVRTVRAFLQWGLEQHVAGVVPDGWWRGIHALAVGMKQVDSQIFNQTELDQAKKIKEEMESLRRLGDLDAAHERMGLRESEGNRRKGADS